MTPSTHKSTKPASKLAAEAYCAPMGTQHVQPQFASNLAGAEWSIDRGSRPG